MNKALNIKGNFPEIRNGDVLTGFIPRPHLEGSLFYLRGLCG